MIVVQRFMYYTTGFTFCQESIMIYIVITFYATFHGINENICGSIENCVNSKPLM